LRKIFTRFLRSQRRLIKDRSSVYARREKILDAKPISERPEELDSRQVPGLWKEDLIIGKNDAKSVREAFSNVLTELDPSVRLSIIYDKGLEMGVKGYFTVPSSPWQRGTNKNTKEFKKLVGALES
jgi:transposase, IS30 family